MQEEILLMMNFYLRDEIHCLIILISNNNATQNELYWKRRGNSKFKCVNNRILPYAIRFAGRLYNDWGSH